MFITCVWTLSSTKARYTITMVLDFGCIFTLPPQHTQHNGNGANGPHVKLYVETETGNEFWQVLLWNIIIVVAAVCLSIYAPVLSGWLTVAFAAAAVWQFCSLRSVETIAELWWVRKKETERGDRGRKNRANRYISFRVETQSNTDGCSRPQEAWTEIVLILCSQDIWLLFPYFWTKTNLYILILKSFIGGFRRYKENSFKNHLNIIKYKFSYITKNLDVPKSLNM